jgi:uncharacterized cupin superfamily protein
VIVNLLAADVEAGRRRLTVDFDAQMTGLSLYELQPGESSWKYHYELHREEWLVVVDGELVVRAPSGDMTLRAGDVHCFPMGPGGAHAVRNESDAVARYAMPSSWRPEGFVAVRPDEGTALLVGPGFRRVASLLPEDTAWV